MRCIIDYDCVPVGENNLDFGAEIWALWRYSPSFAPAVPFAVTGIGGFVLVVEILARLFLAGLDFIADLLTLHDIIFVALIVGGSGGGCRCCCGGII